AHLPHVAARHAAGRLRGREVRPEEPRTQGERTMKPISALLALSLLLSWGVAASPAGAGIAVPPAPPTRSAPVAETVHGVSIVDDYRWLEGDDADPKAMGAMTPEVAAWTEAQNAYTRGILDRLPGRQELEAKLRPLMQVGTVSLPFLRGD